MSYVIEYWTNEDFDFHADTLTISAAHGARLHVTSNHRNPLSSVGRFSLVPTADEVDPLVLAVSAPELFALESPELIPDEVFRRISVQVDGREAFERLCASRASTAFSNAENVLVKFWNEAVRHPERVLDTTFSVAPAAAPEGSDHVTVALSLRNPGPLPIAIPGPDDWTSKHVHLLVRAHRNDMPEAEFFGSLHQAFLDLGSAALARKPPGPGSAIVIIPPGASSELELRGSLPLARGSYDVWGAFSTPLLDEHGAVVLDVDSVSTKQTLTRD